MELSDIGEFGFIKRFARNFDSLIGEDAIGIGDDCALLPLNDEETYVVTTDLLIEDIHFLKEQISPEALGHKSLAVSLSDVAAMGATPRFSFLSIGIAEDTDMDFLDGFMKGFQALSEKYHTPLMGGDTTKSSGKLMVNVVVVGQCKKSDVKLRSMAKAGDLVCVTGNLGDSAGGLKAMLNNMPQSQESQKLIKKHHQPDPQIEKGVWLSQQFSVHAMMDISDGIASDLKHILKASEKAANVYVDKLPMSNTLRNMAATHAWDSVELATSGGEDYELLFTLDKAYLECVQEAFRAQFSEAFYVIGEIKTGDAQIDWFCQGDRISIQKSGFNHFAGDERKS